MESWVVLMELCGFQWASDVSGAQVTGTPTGQEIVFWSRVEARRTWSAYRSHRPRLTWPPIGERMMVKTSISFLYVQIFAHFWSTNVFCMWCRFSGMTTYVFWAWVITTFSSTTPLSRSHSSCHTSSQSQVSQRKVSTKISKYLTETFWPKGMKVGEIYTNVVQFLPK